MHLFDIPQCTIQNRNVHISVLNGTLWDIEPVHYGICEIGLLRSQMPCVTLWGPWPFTVMVYLLQLLVMNKQQF